MSSPFPTEHEHPTFAIGEEHFLLDEEPLQIISGSLHYFRIHPDLWEDRILSARSMGLNTIETYVPWNFHEQEPGVFSFEGSRDLGAFLDLIASLGMHAIVRPGPYICAEWNNGGLPAWLFMDPEMGLRRNEPRYLAAVASYFEALFPHLIERQVDHGGPILMMQVENEYGAYDGIPLDERATYLRSLVTLMRDGGITVPLFTSDQPDDEHLGRGGLPELHKTANFGSRAPERLATLRRHQPTGPLMCMEFWNGWFDMVREFHHVTSPASNTEDLKHLLGVGASVNMYMAHGGTNFGFSNGANDKGIYRPVTTSYDYDAPIAEDGAATEKFTAFRDAISEFRTIEHDAPREREAAPVGSALLEHRLALREFPEIFGSPTHHEDPPTHEEIGAWTGFVEYATQLHESDLVIVASEIRDRAIVMLDDAPVGLLERSSQLLTAPMPARSGELKLLVEDQGRVNYGSRIGEAKGIIGPVRTVTRTLHDWTVRPLSFNHVRGDGEYLRADISETAFAAPIVDPNTPVAGPVMIAGRHHTVAGVDHFMSLDGWAKGVVWFNGFCLGRYWSAGPTRTLYIPGPIVREDNEIVIFELHGAAATEVRFHGKPGLGPI